MGAKRRAPTWSLAGASRQDGRVAIVTGANTGIGFEVAAALAALGAKVVLACRDPTRANAARDRILAAWPAAEVEVLRLDLASLASVRAAAAAARERFAHADLLVNNAAVLHRAPARTADGFELHFGTNHLGHFAFTGLVLDLLLATPGSRVVTVGSNSHRRARLSIEDVDLPRRGFAGYGHSKLATLMFAFELQRRLAAAGATTISVVGDPGSARTEVLRHTRLRLAYTAAMRPLTAWIVQPAAQAALGPLRAALDPALNGGEHVAPRGRFGLVGHPVLTEPSAHARDATLQRQLWEISEQMTGVTFAFNPR